MASYSGFLGLFLPFLFRFTLYRRFEVFSQLSFPSVVCCSQFPMDPAHCMQTVAHKLYLGERSSGTYSMFVFLQVRMRRMPSYYKRYVDDTFAIIPGPQAATSFLVVLNSKHSSLSFTMETATDNTLPSLRMNISENGTRLSASVYSKPTNHWTLSAL